MVTTLRQIILGLVVLSVLSLLFPSCGFDEVCDSGNLKDYQGELNFDYEELYEETIDCIVNSGLKVPQGVNRPLPKLMCVDAVRCSELTENNCILNGVAGRYCINKLIIAIPCYYNELQDDPNAAYRLTRHEMIHHLGYEEDYQHKSPIWDICN